MWLFLGIYGDNGARWYASLGHLFTREVASAGDPCAFHFVSQCTAKNYLGPGLSSTNPPENRKGTIKPGPVPDFPPNPHVNSQNPIPKHHHSVSLTSSPTLSTPWRDCDEVICSELRMSTAIGSPCDWVLPVRVTIDLGMPSYIFFTHITEFEVEMPAGTFLKQSQIKIIAAVGLKEKEQLVSLYSWCCLVRNLILRQLCLFMRGFGRKRCPINKSIFGDYEVIYVRYSGLHSSPPSMPRGSTELDPDNDDSNQYPLIAVVLTSKSKKLNVATIAVIVVSTFVLILACSGIKCLGPNSMNNSPSDSIVLAMASCPPTLKVFSLSEIEKATEKFCSNKILGEGGFGKMENV